MKIETDTSGKWVKTEIVNMYLEEIKLSRELANAIGAEIDSFGDVVPFSVQQAYLRLLELYERQIENGIQ